MNSTTVFALVFAIGMIAGLRAPPPPAVVSWAAHLGWLNLQDSHLAWLGSTGAVGIFSIAALAEIINGKMPRPGSRLGRSSLGIRSIHGAFAGSGLAIAARQSSLLGILVAIVGALAGSFIG